MWKHKCFNAEITRELFPLLIKTNKMCPSTENTVSRAREDTMKTVQMRLINIIILNRAINYIQHIHILQLIP